MKQIEQIRLAVTDMMKKVSFEEGKHLYTRKSDGKFFTGVTSVTGLLQGGDKQRILMSWASKEVVIDLGFYDIIENDTEIEQKEALLSERLEHIKTLKPTEFYDLLKKSKGAFGRRSKKALEIGTACHKWLEKYIKAQLRDEDIPKIPKELKRPIGQFLKWEEENIKEWILSEARVIDMENEYAGTLDALAYLKTGELALIDFKAANQISKEHYLQAAAYQKPFEDYGIHIDKRIIVRLPKTLELKDYDKKNRIYRMKSNDLEALVIPTDYNFDIETFLALCRGFKWLGYVKNM